jgi:hypothetical protein
MVKQPAKKKPQADHQQIARKVLDRISPDADGPVNEQSAKNPAAVALGRLGGLKGGKARADKLTAAKRRAIAKKAAQAQSCSAQDLRRAGRVI